MSRGTVGQGRVLIIKSNAISAEDLHKNDARNVIVKYLIDERHGANRFSLRSYTVGKGGQTPLDRHEYEHQVYILSGEGMLRTNDDAGPVQQPVRTGDAIFIPTNAVHQFINEADQPLAFLCVKGNPRLYTHDTHHDADEDRLTPGATPEDAAGC